MINKIRTVTYNNEKHGFTFLDDDLEGYVIDIDFTRFDVVKIDGIPVTWVDIDSTRIYMCGDECLFTETIVTVSTCDCPIITGIDIDNPQCGKHI